GNKKNNHYYSAEMLEKYAEVFKGAKMYTTDHRPDEKSVRTEVSQVLECPIKFTETGAPVARVGVFDEQFAQNIRNRAALGKLQDLNVSILANGTAKPGFEEGGRKGKNIESISAEGVNVDWVTRAGAGGRALALAENNQEEGMPDKEQLEEQAPDEELVEEAGTEPVDIVEDDAETEPVEEASPEPEPDAEPEGLSEADAWRVLGETALPDASRERLAARPWDSEEALEEEIEKEAAYVAELTGAGRPVGQEKEPVAEQKPADEVLQEQLDAIDKRYGVYREVN
ncbi:unnamed protein product, partial [marine sediment metagenome]